MIGKKSSLPPTCDVNFFRKERKLFESSDAALASADIWCRDASGRSFGYDAFLQHAKRFHGHAAPGLVLGAKMVEIAASRLPAETLFDAVCETGNCLPDAVQILTPCTVGNGWLTILPIGRFALALYDKYTGEGFRVALSADRVRAFPEIDAWFFKRKAKSEQDTERLMEEIRRSEDRLYAVSQVRVRFSMLKKKSLGPTVLCPACGESYPSSHGPVCRSCDGQSPYQRAG